MLDNYQDLIDELLGAPALLRGILGESSSSEVTGLIVLLTERDSTVLERLNRMRHEANPHLRALPAIDAIPLPVPDLPAAELMARFEQNRGELVSLLMNLTLRDWERRATHEIAGELSVADEVEQHVEFDEELRARIEAAVS